MTGREAATIPPAEATVIGPLSEAEVYAGIASNIGEVKRCYQEGLDANPDLDGLVKVKFVITQDGRVTSATAWDSTLHDASVEVCIERALLRFQFPAPHGRGIVIVRYPFSLSPVY